MRALLRLAPLPAVLPVVCAFSCIRGPAIEVAAPDEVGYAALIELDPSGGVSRSSALAAWSSGDPLPIVARGGGTTLIVGYGGAAVDALIARDPSGVAAATRGSAQLRVATGCAQALPAPLWAARWLDGEAPAPIPPAEVPRLTADWLDLACPDLALAPLAIDLGCTLPRCAPLATPIDRCHLRLDLAGCGIGEVTATIDAAGGYCLDLSAARWSCQPRAAEPPGPAAAYQCVSPACTIDVYVDPGSAPPPYTLDRLTLFPAPPHVNRISRQMPILYPGALMDAYAYDFLLLGDRALVAVTAGPVALPACPVDAGPGRLLGFDLETLRQTSTATAPACLSRLLPDPTPAPGDGPGAVAAFVEDGAWWLGRFDQVGRRRSKVRIDLPRFANSAFHSLKDLVALEGGTIAAVFSVDGRPIPADLIVTIHDASSLAEVSRHLRPAFHPESALAVGPETLALSTDDARELVWLDTRTGVQEALQLPSERGGELGLYGLNADPSSGELLLGRRGDSGLYAVRRQGRSVAASTAFERDTAILALHPWPMGQHQLLAAGSTITAWDATVTIYDADRRRFLPGTWTIGHGVVTRVRADPRGRLWLLLPWAAELVRLTPR